MIDFELDNFILNKEIDSKSCMFRRDLRNRYKRLL